MTVVRRRHRTELFASERPPRLVLRFAIVLSLALAIASALILLVVHQFAISEAEHGATKRASLIASALLASEIRSDDLAGTVSRKRGRELDRAFRHELPKSDAIELALVRRDGLVTYSTDRRLTGTRASEELTARAAEGTIVSRVENRGSQVILGDPKALETYAPVGRPGGAALILMPYAPIAGAARGAQFRVGLILEGLLLTLFVIFVPLLARITRRIQEQIDRIHFQAYYDDLTGLPNRAQLFEKLELGVRRASEQGRNLAVLIVDLDRFREVNNTLGHETGDGLLSEVASRFEEIVDAEGLLARLGGDEFAVVIEYSQEKDVTSVAAAMRSALETASVVNGTRLAIDATIGMALYPKDGEDPETLLKHAEVATCTAKEWRVGVLSYTPAVDPHDPEQLALVMGLRDAAENGELSIHYQPKVDLASETVCGYEALAYWNHPTRGLLPPGAFIPIAERTGAVKYVTKAVLAGAVAQLKTWGDVYEDMTVSVNLTAVDLLDTRLPSQLRALLRKSGIAPYRLCIELTERTLMAAPDRARAIVKRIVAAGVRVSIDDFGTGHSSLAHLKNLPVHEVKIDRSFVSDMNVSHHDRMIVLAAIQLGHSLGLQVVAEGVESEETHAALTDFGCDIAQGFLYGRPAPADSLEPMPVGIRRTVAA